MTFELSVWPKLANSNYELDWTTMCFRNWRIFAIKRALANNGFGVLQRATAAAVWLPQLTHWAEDIVVRMDSFTYCIVYSFISV